MIYDSGLLLDTLRTVALERIWKWGGGHTSGAKLRKFLFVAPLHFFWLYEYN